MKKYGSGVFCQLNLAFGRPPVFIHEEKPVVFFYNLQHFSQSFLDFRPYVVIKLLIIKLTEELIRANYFFIVFPDNMVLFGFIQDLNELKVSFCQMPGKLFCSMGK
ncbi:hypothetical protein D9M68_537330 [compost metagenome]